MTSDSRNAELRAGQAASARELADLAHSGLVILGQPGMEVTFEVHHIVDRAGYLYELLWPELIAADPPDPAADDQPDVKRRVQSNDETSEQGQDVVMPLILAEEPDTGLGHELDGENDDDNDGDDDAIEQPEILARMPPFFVETLTAGANGIGVVIGTRARPGHAALYLGRTEHGGLPVPKQSSRPNVFRGVARPNPSFAHASQGVFEAIISVVDPSAQRLSFEESVAVRDLLAFISNISANQIDAPILYAQWPAQLPLGSDAASSQSMRLRVRPGIPSHSSSLALRFAIALPDASSAKRLKVADEVIGYCEQQGFGLWLADTRLGYGIGSWCQMRSIQEEFPDATGTFRREHKSRVRVALPVTLVGPARTGSTFAIMNFLCSLPFVGVIACSNTTLDDVAFIHLQLAVAGLTPVGVINANAALAQVDTEGLSPSHVLQKVFAALGQDVDDRLEADLLGHVSTKMQDYETLVGSLFLVVPPKERQMAVWFSWQSNGDDDGLKSALSTLFSSFEKLGLVRTRGKRAFAQYTAPMLEYLICRQISGQLLRGKGKLSVPTDAIDQMYRSDDPQPAASIFCATLETVWRDQARGIVALSDLTVAWHESWLGHRSGGL